MQHYLKVLFSLLLCVICLLLVYISLTGCYFKDENHIVLGNYEKYILTVDKIENVKNESIVKEKQKDVYNVWCIFTKLKRNERSLEDKFTNMLVSLLNTTNSELNLNIVVDTSSRNVAKDIVFVAKKLTKKNVNVEYLDVHQLSNKLDDLLVAMRPHFSSQPGAYYSDSLFFISVGLFRIAPLTQDKAIMLDIDTVIKEDIVQLFQVFNNFNSSNVFGASPELTPVYHHILYIYRNKNKGTLLGEPHSSGGFPGVNSGVLLLHLENMRKSQLYQSLLTKDAISTLAEKYSFKGHLGDQDFYTLICLEYPELIYLLDCGWNRQLCTWWKEHGYHDTFDKFAECRSSIKIYHGNCNSAIPAI